MRSRARAGEGSGVNKQSSFKSGLKCINGNHRTACGQAFSPGTLCRGLKKRQIMEDLGERAAVMWESDAQRSCSLKVGALDSCRGLKLLSSRSLHLCVRFLSLN